MHDYNGNFFTWVPKINEPLNVTSWEGQLAKTNIQINMQIDVMEKYKKNTNTFKWYG